MAKLPSLREPLFIAGFDGWGNALNVSHAMVTYMIRKLNAEYFARVNSELFFRYDQSRPYVNIEGGILKSISPPDGSFYAASAASCGRDIVLFKSNEPQLRWTHFVGELLSICQQLGVKTVIALGSMFDNVLHSDRILSAVASNEDLLSDLLQEKVIPIDYKGPSAIHSTILSEAQKRGFKCLSLWCHCPYYLEGTTHFGLLAHLGALLASLGGFELDTEELQAGWKNLSRQIQELMAKNPDLETMVNDIRRAKARGSWAGMKESAKKSKKIINLSDFFK